MNVEEIGREIWAAPRRAAGSPTFADRMLTGDDIRC